MSPPQTGSLIIFRVHSAITDDAQSLVEFITILLSEGTFEKKDGKDGEEQPPVASGSSPPQNGKLNAVLTCFDTGRPYEDLALPTLFRDLSTSISLTLFRRASSMLPWAYYLFD